MLEKWMAAGKHFIREMNLEDMAALKFCLLALGALLGLSVPRRRRLSSAFWAALVFVFTCIPLMYRFFVSLVTVRREEKR